MLSLSTRRRGTAWPPGRSGRTSPSCFKCETIRSRRDALLKLDLDEPLRLGTVVLYACQIR
jgi:hypothetical protein